ncbi:MAG: DUF998 domain-containing protein [Roseiflexaceae bacterium]|nr:DUF998 domain-containing protein [Roseiflexaceae bacterium]
MRPFAIRRLPILAGILGPLILGIAITSLSILQYDFMRSLRWHPLDAPTTDWPSGLALGPYGAWMTLTFIVCGILLIVFARALAQTLRASRTGRIGAQLLVLAGIAMIALSSPTDPTYGAGPATITGRIHDAAYVVLALSLLPAMLYLAGSFRNDPQWQGYTLLTLCVTVLVGPAFVFKGFLFYGLLIAIIIWFEALAVRMWMLQASD